jgi:glycosyltransferase 2 family protein
MTAGSAAMREVPRGRRIEPWLRLAAILVGTVAVAGLVRNANVARIETLVARVGWPLAFVLLPTGIAMGIDAAGWRLILGALGHKVSWRALLRARLAVESIVLAAPGGAVAGEALKVGLLHWRAGVPLAAGTASLALTKACLWASEAVYLLIAIAATGLGGGARWPMVALTVGGAATVGTIATLAFAVLRDGRAAARIGTALTHLPITRVRRWLEDRRTDFATLDAATRSFFEAPLGLRMRCLLTFTFEWLIEGAETLLILRLLGVDISVGDALMLDGVTSLLRALAFFVPAGIGVQDATQLFVMRALGVADATTAAVALIFIKRTKEVFWVFTGSLFFAGTKDS